jgi:hypothetical protein
MEVIFIARVLGEISKDVVQLYTKQGTPLNDEETISSR